MISHPSDHSAVNFRHNVIVKLCAYCLDSSDKTQFSLSLFRESTNLISERPGFEALWYHRRFLADLVFANLLSYDGKIEPNCDKDYALISLMASASQLDRSTIAKDDGNPSGIFCKELLRLKTSKSNWSQLPFIQFLESEFSFAVFVCQQQRDWNSSKQETYCKKYALHLSRKVNLLKED